MTPRRVFILDPEPSAACGAAADIDCIEAALNLLEGDVLSHFRVVPDLDPCLFDDRRFPFQHILGQTIGGMPQ